MEMLAAIDKLRNIAAGPTSVIVADGKRIGLSQIMADAAFACVGDGLIALQIFSPIWEGVLLRSIPSREKITMALIRQRIAAGQPVKNKRTIAEVAEIRDRKARAPN